MNDGRMIIERVPDGVMVTVTSGLNQGKWKLSPDAARWAGERLISAATPLGNIGAAAIAIDHAKGAANG